MNRLVVPLSCCLFLSSCLKTMESPSSAQTPTVISWPTLTYTLGNLSYQYSGNELTFCASQNDSTGLISILIFADDGHKQLKISLTMDTLRLGYEYSQGGKGGQVLTLYSANGFYATSFPDDFSVSFTQFPKQQGQGYSGTFSGEVADYSVGNEWEGMSGTFSNLQLN